MHDFMALSKPFEVDGPVLFVERLWRTVRYQDFFLWEYDSVADMEEGLSLYIA